MTTALEGVSGQQPFTSGKDAVPILQEAVRAPEPVWTGDKSRPQTVSQLVKNYPHFMELEGSLPHSQVPVTCTYPESARSSTYHHIALP